MLIYQVFTFSSQEKTQANKPTEKIKKFDKKDMRNDKEIAKRLYLSGMKLSNIASELDIPYQTVKGWSSDERWTEIRIREESLNDRISRYIDKHLDYMEGMDGIFSDSAVVNLVKLVSIQQKTRVKFADKVKISEDILHYAQANKKHEDAQSVAETVKDYCQFEHDKLEE